MDHEQTPVGRIDALEVFERHVRALAEDDHLVIALLRVERTVAQSFGDLAEVEPLTGAEPLSVADRLRPAGLHELHAPSVDEAVARDRDVVRLLGVEDAGQLAVVALVLREVERGAQDGARLHAEFDVRAQIERTCEVGASGDEHHAAACGVAVVDGALDRGRGERRTVGCGAVGGDVPDRSPGDESGEAERNGKY